MEEDFEDIEWLLGIQGQIASSGKQAELADARSCLFGYESIGPAYPDQLDVVAIVENIELSKN